MLAYADCPADGAGGRASLRRSLDRQAGREAVCLSVFQLLPPGPEALPFSLLHTRVTSTTPINTQERFHGMALAAGAAPVVSVGR